MSFDTRAAKVKKHGLLSWLDFIFCADLNTSLTMTISKYSLKYMRLRFSRLKCPQVMFLNDHLEFSIEKNVHQSLLWTWTKYISNLYYYGSLFILFFYVTAIEILLPCYADLYSLNEQLKNKHTTNYSITHLFAY